MNRRQFLGMGAPALLSSAALAQSARGQGPSTASPTPLPGPAADGWVSLFNGRNLDGWYTYLTKYGKNNDPQGSVRVDNGMLHILGNPATETVEAGYIATNQEYSNYRLRLEYKWGSTRFAPRLEAKRDNGILIHVVGPDRVWPTCMEMQVQESDVGDAIPVTGVRYMGVNPGAGLPPWPTAPNANALVSSTERRRTPRFGDFEKLDDWNVLDVIVREDSAAFVVNGRIVNSVFKMERPDPFPPVPAPGGAPQNAQTAADAKFVRLDRGRIALEVEYAETWFKSIALRPLRDGE